MENLATTKIDKPSIFETSPNWNSVQNFLNNTSINSVPSFDLFVSRREGHEFEIHLKLLPDNAKKIPKDSFKTPIVIPAALYDLFW